jgi:hypothetical protein
VSSHQLLEAASRSEHFEFRFLAHFDRKTNLRARESKAHTAAGTIRIK